MLTNVHILYITITLPGDAESDALPILLSIRILGAVFADVELTVPPVELFLEHVELVIH